MFIGILRIMRIALFFIVATFCALLYADQIEKQYFSDMRSVTHNLFCNDKNTLEYINNTKQNCNTYIDSISEKCLTRFTNAIPDFDSLKELFDNEKILLNLSELYFMCVKAEIFEDVEGVYLLKDVSDETLPPGRSATFPLVIYKNIRAELDANSYKYSVRCIEGVEWLVWDKSDSKKVNEIIDDVTDRTLLKVKNEAALSDKGVDLSTMPNCEFK